MFFSTAIFHFQRVYGVARVSKLSKYPIYLNNNIFYAFDGIDIIDKGVPYTAVVFLCPSADIPKVF